MEMIELFKEGGFIMWPLLLGFVISVIVTVDKMITLKKFNNEVRSLDTRVQNGELGLENEGTYNHILFGPYKLYFSDEKATQEDIVRQTAKTQKELKAKLWLIGTVTSSAPFVGLFGTVIGIIKSFASIGQAGKAGFAIVSADLSEALIATAAGIIVAVIALVFYNYLTQKIKDSFFEYQFNLENHLSKWINN